MFEVTVNTRRAVVGTKELITTSSAGIQVQFTFSEDWDELSKIAIFRNGDEGQEVAVALPNSNLTVIPAQSCSEDFVDEPLFVGVYGTDGLGAVIIPTVWTSLGVLRPGAVTTDIITPPEPTPDMWAQILAIANEAAAIADECEANEELRVAAEQLRAGAETARANAEVLRAAAEDARAENENQRQGAETQRQAAEDARAQAEALRIQAEELRQTNETSRVSAESDRASAEQTRQTNEATRASNEAARVTAEQNRASAETQRTSAESSRVTEETSRVSAESSRATAEQDRASAETARASAESQRVTAENNRVSAEQNRVNAEDERVQAETDRATEFATWENTIASKVPNTRTVNGKALSTDITLDAGDIGYDSTGTYQAGSVGAELQEQNRQLSDKQDAPATAGTAGQVLGLDSNLAPVWVNQSGGGGGVSDYTQLTNKPQINGHTLTGNQSAADLGLGTYSKPSGGIPKTDLAQGVQQSLNKADSALQTAPVQSVAGKTGAVTLGAGDVGYSESETYQSGTVGYEVSELSRQLSDKQDKPATAGTAGQVLSLDNQLNPVWTTPSGGGDVTDVQINGTSILSDGVANIPIGRYDLGVFKIGATNGYYGIFANGDGVISVEKSSDSEVKSGSNLHKPIVPSTQHQSAFYGLAKAAGDTTQSQSSNPVGTYTDEAKAAIKSMLGVADGGGGGGMNIVNLSGTQITQVGADNTFYVCGELTELTFTAPSVGITMIRFTSGTTPTVLTVNGVTSWMFDNDPTAASLEANKTYDINVLNGVGVVGWA